MTISVKMPEIEYDTEEERKEILKRYRKLYRSVKPYFKEGDANLVKDAFKTASDAHREMRRKTGEPYIYHPIEVAQIAVDEISLGPTAVAAALLHDVVEDTDATVKDIEQQFGKKVAQIVDGVTKIPFEKELEWANNASSQAENFRKMLLALSDDARVIFIKLADRLHNMRTLGAMPRPKQLKIASETIYIYAPLAHRLGLYKIKSELEDLYLKYTQEETYRDIAQKLRQTKAKRNKYIQEFITPLQEALDKQGFKARVIGRSKSIYSIWNKMRRQNVTFDKIYDLFAIRVILDTEEDAEKTDCWRIYSLVTDHYRPNPDRLRDWISIPKSNGYESLHTTVMGPEGRWVEVQIRTQRMDEIAEKGYAAHWKYKERRKQTKGIVEDEKRGLDGWLQALREMREQNEGQTALEFVDDFRANLFNEEVFVFTPKGDLKTLPKGATALDFAYEIHTEVGNSCLGAKINQKIVPLNYNLKNGDQVEILTSKKQKPATDWLQIVVTGKAKSNIRDFIRKERRDTLKEGREILDKKLKQINLEFSDSLLNQLRNYLDLKHPSDVLLQLGNGYLSPSKITKFRNWKQRSEDKEARKTEGNSSTIPIPPKKEQEPIVIGENSQLDYTLATCCNPIRGDDIFGYITINNGIKIHRATCPNAPALLANYGYRVIRAVWKSEQNESFLVELGIKGNDRIGLIQDVTRIISNNMKVNIESINLGKADEGIFEGCIRLYVSDVNHLSLLRNKLTKVEGVVSVDRLDEV